MRAEPLAQSTITPLHQRVRHAESLTGDATFFDAVLDCAAAPKSFQWLGNDTA
jgi:hypothetical protein